MKLFVNGCSHTEGTKLALDNNLKQAWPFKLQKLLGPHWDISNYSLAGGSNERIVRTTIENVSLAAIPPDLAVIQFTNPFRFEVPSADDNSFLQVLPHVYIDPEYADVSKEFFPCGDFIKTFYNHKDYKARVLVHEKFITQLLTLQNFFQNYDIPYIFIIWWDLEPIVQEMPLTKVVDKSCILNYNPSTNKIDPMDNILHSYGYKLANKIRSDGTRDKHYMVDGHDFISDNLYNFYIRKKHLVSADKVVEDEIEHVYD